MGHLSKWCLLWYVPSSRYVSELQGEPQLRLEHVLPLLGGTSQLSACITSDDAEFALVCAGTLNLSWCESVCASKTTTSHMLQQLVETVTKPDNVFSHLFDKSELEGLHCIASEQYCA